MVRPVFSLCLIAFFFAGHCLGETATLSFETPYNHITIERGGSIVEMRSVWRSKLYRESAVDLSDPSRLVVPYTTFIAASAMFHANPRSVLMIGLGGGGFNQFFEKAFPSAMLETVEVDAQVCALAEKYLAFKPSDRNKVTVLDGRMFLRRSKATYDWIILDAFRGGFVPPHLKTVEFYKLAQSHLAPDGVFIANVRKDTALFASDLRTMRAVFPQVGFFDVPQTENAVIVGVNWVSPSLQTRVESAGRLSFNPVFRRNVDPVAAGKLFRLASGDPDKKATVLTDDFAPTEFLDAMKNSQSRR
jgi:spermidine synthase